MEEYKYGCDNGFMKLDFSNAHENKCIVSIRYPTHIHTEKVDMERIPEQICSAYDTFHATRIFNGVYRLEKRIRDMQPCDLKGEIFEDEYSGDGIKFIRGKANTTVMIFDTPLILPLEPAHPHYVEVDVNLDYKVFDKKLDEDQKKVFRDTLYNAFRKLEEKLRGNMILVYRRLYSTFAWAEAVMKPRGLTLYNPFKDPMVNNDHLKILDKNPFTFPLKKVWHSFKHRKDGKHMKELTSEYHMWAVLTFL